MRPRPSPRILPALASAAACLAGPYPSHGQTGFRHWNPAVASEVPVLLSATGLYQDIRQGKIIPSALPYDVNSALWSDGAAKSRWVLLNPGTSIAFREKDDVWGYPDSVVFVKEFAIDTLPGDPRSRTRWETRLLLNRKAAPDGSGILQDRWYGFSYRWRSDGSDAELVPADGRNDSLRVWPQGLGGPSRMRKWRFPARLECMQCHRGETVADTQGRAVLGFFTAQLNRPSRADGRVNQLEDFFARGSLKGVKPADWSRSPRWPPIGDSAAGLDARARAYIAANCSGCHGTRGNTVRAAFDGVRLNYDFHDMAPRMEFRGKPLSFDFGLGGIEPVSVAPSLVAPGVPRKSILLFRQLQRNTRPGDFRADQNQMPPLGSYAVDTAAVAVLTKWIEGMPPAALGPHGPTRRAGSEILRASVEAGWIRLRAAPYSLPALGLPARARFVAWDGRYRTVFRIGPDRYALPAGLMPGMLFLQMDGVDGAVSRSIPLTLLRSPPGSGSHP